jgi:hypothetical protein
VSTPEWLRAFKAVIRKTEPRKKGSNDAMLQARFLNALSQLQIVGLFKKSKSSADVAGESAWVNVSGTRVHR